MYQPLVKYIEKMEAREMAAAKRFRDAVDAAAEREGMAHIRHLTEQRSVFCPKHFSGVYAMGDNRAEAYQQQVLRAIAFQEEG